MYTILIINKMKLEPFTMEGFFMLTSSGCLGGDTRVFPTHTME
jgi:hypothetical protein